MKIAVIGPGAVGSYYGAELCRDGHETHFLLRSDYEHVRRHGVSIISPEGNFNARPKCALKSEQIGIADVVLIAIKTTANAQLPALVGPLVGTNTAILTLQNGLGNEEALAEFFAAEQILGGLCFVCLNRISPGVIQHIAHGKIEMGEFQRWPEPRTHDIASAFRHAGVPCRVRDNLEKAHWEKLVWNIPFNGLGVASCAGYNALVKGTFSGRVGECLTTDKLLGDPEWFKLLCELMAEIIATGNAHSFNIPGDFADEMIGNTRIMGAYKASTLIDFEKGLPLELEAMFREPLRRARAKGVSTPRLENLTTVLARLDPESRFLTQSSSKQARNAFE
jgi:2-dehydropantoate 2-reductase